MTRDRTSTRRSFLRGGAVLAAPMAAASLPVAVLAEERSQARARRLEEETAIRELHQAWLRQVNAAEGDPLLERSVRRITAHHAGMPERIEIAADGRSAVGRFDYTVETEAPLPRDSTLAQMAHAQGHGTVRRTERRMLSVDYAKSGGRWNITRVALTAL